MKITTLQQASDDASRVPKLLIYGPAGTGKTSIIGCTSLKVLLISRENGLVALKGCPANITVAIVEQLSDVLDAVKLARSGKFEMVAVDSASEIAELYLADEQKKTKDGRAAYGETLKIMNDVLKAFRDLPIPAVIIAKELREKVDAEGNTFCSPMFPGAKLSAQSAYLFDVVMHAEVKMEMGQPVYMLRTRGTSSRLVAKDRTGTLAELEPHDLDAIFEKISGQKKASDVDWSSIDDEKEGAK